MFNTQEIQWRSPFKLMLALSFVPNLDFKLLRKNKSDSQQACYYRTKTLSIIDVTVKLIKSFKNQGLNVRVEFE